MKLEKGMYGSEFRSKKGPFGLACGQMRGHDFCHNAGWYNKAGEKLGWGDLSLDDIRTICREIDPGELFVILSEHDSFWKFTTSIGTIGSMCSVRPDAEAPGVDYIAEHARYIIANGAIYALDAREDFERDGVFFQVQKPEDAKYMLKQYNQPAVEKVPMETIRNLPQENPMKIIIVGMLMRPGVSEALTEIEHSLFPPGSAANEKFELMIVNWPEDGGLPWAVAMVPIEYKSDVFAICARCNLKSIQGAVPMSISSKRVEAFVFDSADNVFTLETDHSHA